jgi:heptosyltransferase-2
MNTLIIKLGATGDVVRTTPLLQRLAGQISWITADKNLSLLQKLSEDLRSTSWERRDEFRDKEYDLVINLEDTLESAQYAATIKSERVFGARLETSASLGYSDDASGWFDLSLISRFGKTKADRLKLQNRRTYQDLIFSGLGLHFAGEKYWLPAAAKTSLKGDVAIAPKAGHVWPMKNWAYYAELKRELEAKGLVVNLLPDRPTLLEHLGDVANHRCLVSGDSLPMHFALGTGVRCVSLFSCTSPHEIYDYGIMRKIVSPLLDEFFFQRGIDERATRAITMEEVLSATLEQL